MTQLARIISFKVKNELQKKIRVKSKECEKERVQPKCLTCSTNAKDRKHVGDVKEEKERKTTENILSLLKSDALSL